MYAPYMAVSSEGGALTSQQAIALVIVWAEPITGLATSQFKVCQTRPSNCCHPPILPRSPWYIDAFGPIKSRHLLSPVPKLQ